MKPVLWSSTEVFPPFGELPQAVDEYFDRDGLPRASNVKPNFKLKKTSRDGPETDLTFVNQSSQTLELLWLDHTGNAISYTTIPSNSEETMHTYGGHVWRVTTQFGLIVGVFEASDSAASVLLNEDTVRNAAWRDSESERLDSPSPDGRWLVFVADHSLYYRIPDQPERLLSAGDSSASFRKDASRARSLELHYNKPDYPPSLPDVHWAPDSNAFLAIRTAPGDNKKVYFVESSPKHSVQPRLRSYPYLKPGDLIPWPSLHMFVRRPEATSHSHSEDSSAPRRPGSFVNVPVSSQLFHLPFQLDNFQWRSDSKAIRFSYTQRGHQLVRVLEIDLNGRVRVLIDELCRTFFPFNKVSFSVSSSFSTLPMMFYSR